jgi:hypothetical protein
MEQYWSKAVRLDFTGAAPGSYIPGAPYRGVLHTAEAKSYAPSATSYFGHANPPHFTLAQHEGAARMWQHYPITVSARALANPPGGVETNRQGAIQIEICWKAAEIAQLPEPMVAVLKDWMRWVEAQAGVRRHSPAFLDDTAYGSGSPARMPAAAWNSFDGWCGHQHVPENDHWDPGKIDIARLLTP